MINNTLFINESPVYGGHEEMFIRILTYLDLEDDQEVTILTNSKNKKFNEELERIKAQNKRKIKIISHSFMGLPVRPLTNLLAWHDALIIYRAIRSGCFNQVVVVQGTIEIGGLSLFVAKLAGCKVITYIPITKRSKSLGVKFGYLRDYINKYFYYKLPDLFITISSFNKKELVTDFNVNAEKIEIVYNFTEHSSEVSLTSQSIKLPSGINFLLIGRIDFLQKRQDKFLYSFLRLKSGRNVNLHIVGDNDGTQSNTLRANFQNQENIFFHGWRDPFEIAVLIRESDGVILPSLFEGVPLVMIEAVKMHRVVFASNVDGMKEFLPAEWLFDANDLSQAVKLMEQSKVCKFSNDKKLDALKTDFEDKFNAQQTCSAFLKIISR
ncbi:hypothetical protein GCM10027361_23470 [Erwinia aphidicola]|jgi:glycosyltransferase involved in cell wall biosynthesis|uniref:glycosyltransferase family 4 protein n=1 Tax=Erwinia aphidicola TaxID=68334 RepID=UPI0017478587|nr:glycosyltransferase family 4 protein [Erwinia aphidicola]MBD1375531.1 glycosyltransferase family 4 protein [Erwinia aphidicola]